MADEIGTADGNTTMNLDLNLEPGSVAATAENPINLDEWSDDSPDRLREAVRHISSQNQRRRRWVSIENHQTESQKNLTMDLNRLRRHSTSWVAYGGKVVWLLRKEWLRLKRFVKKKLL